MTYQRDSFCGPAGDGKLSELLSSGISAALDRLELDLEDACHTHDVDWNDGPKTVDDLKFAMNVYQQVREQKSPAWASVIALVGFELARATAIVYKHF